MPLKNIQPSQTRCKKCNKLLAVNDANTIEIKCARCGTLNIVLEQMSEQIIVTDSEGTILFVNGAIKKIRATQFQKQSANDHRSGAIK